MVVDKNESTTMKNAGKLLAMSIVMVMQWYDVGHIAQSRASL